MAPSLFLLAAVVLAFTGGAGAWAMVATVAFAAAAGTGLPDLDTPLRLRHRSALLHSVLPPAVALLDARTWLVAAGLGFGIGLHLAADLFPRQMRGYATIKLPLWGSIGPGSSYLWIAVHALANIAGGLVVLAMVADRPVIVGALAAVGVLGAGYLLRTEGGWGALAMFAVLGWLTYR